MVICFSVNVKDFQNWDILWNAWNLLAEGKRFQHNTKCETEKEKNPQISPHPKKPTVHPANKTKSLILIEKRLKGFVKLDVEDKTTVVTKTVAACQKDLDLPAAMVIVMAEMNDVTYPTFISVLFQNFGVA